MEIKPSDITVSCYPKSPVGGMHCGNPQGVKVVHHATGTVVTCETERSQHRNREKCFEQLNELLGGETKVK